eukprot:592239-Rhodomonas_salina.1
MAPESWKLGRGGERKEGTEGGECDGITHTLTAWYPNPREARYRVTYNVTTGRWLHAITGRAGWRGSLGRPLSAPRRPRGHSRAQGKAILRGRSQTVG